ncbi:MAG TPA: YifB family Mg chelatase-like AAA ATPase [Deltaproteobacteria bacterium]|nr:YifB family Mg chelatase-like AAA ATPase [Deltaproteobacteria bacterium]HIJ39488.1 YifB family Mg chelatase-like AAA ATPase [Deltaproteobacteria bacterium]
MLSKIFSSAVTGIDAYVVEVEVDISQGLPSFSTVGLPEGAVKESKERVKAAIKNSGYHFPADRITVNLAPADVKKEGSAFDLPMALGILAATGLVQRDSYSSYLFLGELALDGMIRPVKGVLPVAITARDLGFKGIFLPKENAPEAAVVEGIDVFPVGSLPQIIGALRGIQKLIPLKSESNPFFHGRSFDLDFKDVRGQENAKRAIEISAAGEHNLIMVGPPGSGKTMLAKRLPTILPPLTFQEALDTSKVYSVLGLMPSGSGLITERPFRAPHHTISDAGLIGGGQNPKPGQVSMAHNGVLFLDELPEFRRNVLEVLRQPIEDGQVIISRANFTVVYPAQFMLVAAMNPCPCGFLTDPKRDCSCSHIQIRKYRAKISGPLMDRIDIHLEVPSVPYKDLSCDEEGISSAQIMERVMNARKIQEKRFSRTKILTNARMNSRHIREYCPIDAQSSNLLERAMEKFGLSARAHARILKISRTIADLEGSENIRSPHVAEAIQYRTLDRKMVR